jgi:hypothetical protein
LDEAGSKWSAPSPKPERDCTRVGKFMINSSFRGEKSFWDKFARAFVHVFIVKNGPNSPTTLSEYYVDFEHW